MELLPSDEAHVWLADCELVSGEWSLLSDDERERAMRFHFERDRRHFVAARSVLRRLISHYTGEGPERIRFRYTDRGKPSLDSVPELQFNVSHSHGQALFAFGCRGEIGVDIEKVRPTPVEQLSKRFFSPAEHEAILKLPEDARGDVFFELWVRKEAYLKACGAGLGGGLASIPPNWLLYGLHAPPGYHAALATQTAVRIIQKQFSA
jgi:4'-phosphopantetheinyl transferase